MLLHNRDQARRKLTAAFATDLQVAERQREYTSIDYV